MRFIELFGGVGGFRLGMRNHNCVGYYEIDRYAVEIYNKRFNENHKPTDIREVRSEDIPDHDILTAGFPCQSFSIAGKRKGFDDTRGTLFFEIARIIQSKRPSILFLENVKGLLSHDNGKTFETILKSLDELGYDAEWQVLNSKHFGVPQNRERVFIIGHLRGKPFKKVFPLGESCEEIDTTQQSISSTIHSGYYKQGGRDQQYVVEKDIMRVDKQDWRKKRDKEDYRVYSQEGVSPSITTDSTPKILSPIEVIGGTQEHAGKMKDQSTALTEAMGKGGGHIPILNSIRRLTPIECERLQGFPDNWTEGVSDTQRYKMLGNAVTVNVIEAISHNMCEEKEDRL